jgi:TPR repeat protein
VVGVETIYFTKEATEACNDRPDDVRLKYQLGRAIEAWEWELARFKEKEANYARALDLYRQAADAGHAMAAYRIGMMDRSSPRDDFAE